MIIRNDAKRLEGCLQRLAWCDQIIVLDMQSTDGSTQIARRYADKLFEIEPYPIAEPARIFAAQQARNDWVLLIDPDEYIPSSLPEQIRTTIQQHPNAGALRLPWLFYFKGKRLTGTVWGGPEGTKWMLVHRDRVELLPLCNCLGRTLPDFDELRIAPTDDNHIRHYWSDSYWDLLKRHLVRYARLDARRMYQQGKRFSLRLGLIHPLMEFNRSFRHFDGWRLGIRGFLLSAIFCIYTAACAWFLLAPSVRRPAQTASTTGQRMAPPTLISDSRKAA